MPIAYPEILNLRQDDLPFSWGPKDAMIYALGVGMGADPLNEHELPFVYEREMKALPTLAGVVAWGALPGAMGLNYMMIVDAERKIIFHKPMTTSGRIKASSRLLGVFDRGPKGAVVLIQNDLTDLADGQPLASVIMTLMARGDGGFGGPSEGRPEPHAVPARSPDQTVDIPTAPNQALLYRLSGDMNPLHIDPAVARMVGFPRPVLHGMCTYGITCRAVLQTYADFDPARFKSHEARFSSPVFPGETISVDLWKDGDVVSFEARVKDRGVTVIKNGRTVLG